MEIERNEIERNEIERNEIERNEIERIERITQEDLEQYFLKYNRFWFAKDLFEQDLSLKEVEILKNGLFRHHQNLQSIFMRAGPRDVNVVFSVLKSNLFFCLTDVNLLGNGITNEISKDLADSLQNNVTLTSLNLNFNNITDPTHLVKALRHHPALKRLTLSQNRIKDEGAQVLAEMIGSVHSTIQLLDLSMNAIGDKGCVALANALETNNKLSNLSLIHNQIGDDGAYALAKVLDRNTFLVCIDLHSNRIKNDLLHAIASATEINKTLCSRKFEIKRQMLCPLAAFVEPFSDFKNNDEQLAWEAGNEILQRMVKHFLPKVF